MKSLGIDLGSNSLGWAVLSDDEISDTGVVIFDEGITREKGKDSIETPAAARRIKRMGRRLKARRRMRKLKVLKLLIEHNMCPLTLPELEEMKKTGKVPDSKEYREWLKSVPSNVQGHVNPYYARAMAADHIIDPALVGRAMYHLAQRRGFKSSRKDLVEDDSTRAKELGKVKSGISQISAELAKRNCTLGQYFYELNKQNQKVRKHYLGRVEHYEAEFDKIADVQNFPPDFRNALKTALFSQRPLRSQSFLVGKCTLEKNHARCQIGHPLFEEFRMYSFLNTIRISDGSGSRFLTLEERDKLIPGFYKKAKYIKFSDITKLLFPKSTKKNPSPSVEFNYSKEKSVSTCSISHSLNTVLDMPYDKWSHTTTTADGKQKTYDYQTIFDAIVFFDDDEKLQVFARQKLGFSDEQAKALSKIIVPEGNAQYSLCAIRKILPFLKAGHDLSKSVFLAKLPDLIGKDAFEKNSQKILNDINTLTEDYRSEKETKSKSAKLIPLTERLNAYLEDTWKLTPDKLEKMYHYSKSAYAPVTKVEEGGYQKLPIVQMGMLRNPLVQRSLGILRKLVNELRRDGKIDSMTRINVELARSVNDRNTRMAYVTWQQGREKLRQEAVAELSKYVSSPAEDLIDKYILLKEQGLKSIYTGDTISVKDLVDGNKTDIEHTVPRSRSGDNSLANKTVCESFFNRDKKKGCLPSELSNYEEILVRLKPWFEKLKELEDLYASQKRSANMVPADEPERKSTARQKALVTKLELDYWRKKLRYFEITEKEIGENFLNRQLVDTGIMTRHAVDFLRSVYPETYPVNGLAVSWARKAWGIQDPYEKKTRDDHTHHAIDAMVIAALDRVRFQKICSAFRDDGKPTVDKDLIYAGMVPFKGFTKKVFESADTILVKSYVRHNELKQTWSDRTRLAKSLKLENGKVRKFVHSAGDTIRGQLHADTFYGNITDPKDNVNKFVVRKFINDQTTFPDVKSFAKIVDGTVAEKLKMQIDAYMQQGKTFKEAVNMPVWMKAPDANGQGGVPILKVRIVCSNITAPHKLKRQLMPSDTEYKNFYYVNSGKDSNFRCALYVNGNGKREICVDNLLDCAKSKEDPNFVPWEKRTDYGKFLGFVYPGRLALIFEKSQDELKNLSQSELGKRMYIFSTIEENGRMTMRFHREARSVKDLNEIFNRGASKLSFDVPHRLLRVSKSTYINNTLFEGIDFRLSIDGRTVFL